MYCTHCGNQIDDKAVICVHCGVATKNFNLNEKNNNAVEEKRTNGFGIAGFVVGLLSLWFGVFLCIPSVIGLSLSIVGIINGKKYKGNGLAIAGLVLSIISIMLWLSYWIVFATIGVQS